MVRVTVVLALLAATLSAARRGDQYRLPPYVLGATGDAGVDAYGRGKAAQRVSHSGVDSLGRNISVDAVIAALPHTVSLDAASNVTSVDCGPRLTSLTIGVEDVGAALADWSASTLLIVGAGWGCAPSAASVNAVAPPAPFLPVDGRTIVFKVAAVTHVNYGAQHSRSPQAAVGASALLRSGIDGADYVRAPGSIELAVAPVPLETAFETLTVHVSRAPGEPKAVSEAATAAHAALAAFALSANTTHADDSAGDPPAWAHGVSPMEHARAVREWRVRAHARRMQAITFYGGNCIANIFTILSCPYGFDATGTATLTQFNTGPAQSSMCPDGNFSTCTRAAIPVYPIAGGLGYYGSLACVDCFASATLGFELSLHMQGLGVQSFSASATFNADAAAALQLQIGASSVASESFTLPLLPSVSFAPLIFTIGFLPIMIDLSGDISLALTLTSGPLATITTPGLWASVSIGAGVSFTAASGWSASPPVSFRVGTSGAFAMTSDFTTTATARAELVFGLDASLYGILPVRATAGPFLQLAVSPEAAACGTNGAGGAAGADLTAGAMWSFEIEQLTLDIFGFQPTLPGLPYVVLPNTVFIQTPALASWCLPQSAVFSVQSSFYNSAGALIAMPAGPFTGITLYTLAPLSFIVAAAFASVSAGVTWFGSYEAAWVPAGVSTLHLTCQDGGNIVEYNYTLMNEALAIDFPGYFLLPFPMTPPCIAATEPIKMGFADSWTVPNCFYSTQTVVPFTATFTVTLSNIYETCEGCCFENSGQVGDSISLIISVNGVDVATTSFSQTSITVEVGPVLCQSSSCNVQVRDNGAVNNCGGVGIIIPKINFDIFVSISMLPQAPFASVGGFVCTETDGNTYAVTQWGGAAIGPRTYVVVAPPSPSATPSTTATALPSPSIASPSPSATVSPSLSSRPTPPSIGALNSGINALRVPARYLMLRSAFGANSSGVGTSLAIAQINVSYVGLGNIVPLLPQTAARLSSTIDAAHNASMVLDASTATYAATAGDAANFMYVDLGANYVGVTSVSFVAYYVSVTATPTSTPTSTPATSTPSPNVNAFLPTSVMVVRLGDVTSSAATADQGIAQPVYFDEYAVDPYSSWMPYIMRTSTALPSTGATPCTLASGISTTGPFYWWDTEGFPTLSADGAAVTTPCYRIAKGSAITDSSTSVKVVSVLDYAGNVDTTSNTMTFPYGGSAGELVAFHNAAAAVGGSSVVSAYVGLAPGWQGFAYGGIYKLTGSSLTPIDLANVGLNDARCLVVYGGVLYGTDSTLDAGYSDVFSWGLLPTTAATPAVLPGLTSSSAVSLFTLAFESATSLWVADVYSIATHNVNHYELFFWGAWYFVGTVSFDTVNPIYSIAGRLEAGAFVLYAATKVTLYRYVYSSDSTSVVATAGAGTLFRGVVMPPQSTNAYVATPLSTSTSTATGTTTATGTATATPTRGTPLSVPNVDGASLTLYAANGSVSFVWVVPQGTDASAAAAAPAGASHWITTVVVPMPAAPTPVVTPSVAATPSATATPGRPLALFQPSSVLVLRIGDAAHALGATAAGVALPVYVDEYDPTGLFVGDSVGADVPVNTVALPTAACTLAHGGSQTSGYWWDTEGFPLLSTDGAHAAFGCYGVAVGATITDSRYTVKTLARLGADGSVDVSTTTMYPFAGTSSFPVALRTALAVPASVSPFDVDGFYFAASPGYYHAGSGGVFWQPLGGTPGLEILIASISGLGNVGVRDARGLSISGGQLYATSGPSDVGCNGVSTLGVGLPSSNVGSTALPGTVAGSPWTFVFDTANATGVVIWAADSSALASHNIVKYVGVYNEFTDNVMFWEASGALSVDTTRPVYSITGRYEAIPANSGGFILYCVTVVNVWRYDTGYATAAVLGSAPAGTAFRGVVLAPTNAGMEQPTPFVTNSVTPTPSPTATATSTVAFALYHATSVLVVSVGSVAYSAATAGTGVALPASVNCRVRHNGRYPRARVDDGVAGIVHTGARRDRGALVRHGGLPDVVDRRRVR